MINAIIIEDELNSRELLHQLLTDFCKEVNIIGVADDAQSGIQQIRALAPDLIFLDIEMPGGDGFEVLKAFDPIPFKVIFVSGYDQYAIQAIRYAALDYLLKPVNIDELETAVSKALEQQSIDPINVDNLEWNFQNRDDKFSGRIVLSNDQEKVFIKLKDVLYLEAEGAYVYFVLADNRKQLATRSMSYYEELLPSSHFFRVHKSYMVNCHKVTSVNAGRGGMIQLEGGGAIPIAFRRKASFVKLIGLDTL